MTIKNSFPGSIHNHSDFSNLRLRDCIIKIEDLINRAIELGHTGVAITEHESISSHIKAKKYYMKIKQEHPDFKLVLGNEIYLCRDGLNKENYVSGIDRFWHFILLAKDEIGHKQIREISSKAWLRSWKTGKMRRVPTYYQDLIDIIECNKGHVIGSSACLGGYLPRLILDNKLEEAYNWVKQMEQLFGKGNFFLELQPPEKKDNEQDMVNHALVKMSEELDIPFIVTTDSHYLNKEDRPIHKAYLNSQDGEREVDSFYATTYMMDTKELESHFESDIDLSLAYKNIQHIFDICEDYSLEKPLKIPRLIWKEFNPKTSIDSWYDKIPRLKTFAESDYEGDIKLAEAIVERLESDISLQNQETYDALNENLDMTWQSSIVNKTHWSAYFLNLQNIIQCCWDAGSLVGPSRGSGLGFILLYILGITQINPLWETTKTYSWRFLNPSRVSVLDVDIDIEGNKRDAVLQHLREVYGEDRVANVATFGTEGSKASILTAARGLGIDVDQAQYIASLIPADRGITRTLSQCYYGDEKEGFKPIATFVQEMNTHKELWEVAQKIEGVVCRLGSHAGGVIFVDEPFTESTALMRTPEGTIITAYELHDSEACSLIKYDLLSIEALDKIHVCLDLLAEADYIEKKDTLKETYENAIGIYKLERTASKMWKMIHKHKILSLFQMEKQSGIQGIALVKPTSVDDLAVLNAALRLMAQEKGSEAPLNKFARFKKDITQWYKEMDSYGLTKEEQEILKKELSISSGLCVLQEQFMRLVQIPECGGFSLEFADRLRKAIAKKNPQAYKELTQEYFEETKKKNLSKNLCNYVWNVLIAMNRGYGFNAAHTLAYSLIGLQEMNLAYKYPIIYWNTANLIVDSGGQGDSTDYTKIAQAVNRVRQEGIDVSLVDINHSNLNFTPDEKNNQIMFGLKALANVNDDFIEDIISNRPYVSILDFLNRIHPKRQAMLSLVKGGAFDQFCGRKEAMIQYLWLTCDKKQRITLQNMSGLIKYDLIPQDCELPKRIFEFNRYLKARCKVAVSSKEYKLDKRAVSFLLEIECEDIINFNNWTINIKQWEKIYQDYMDILRAWIARDKEKILDNLNTAIFMTDWNKYALGNLSSWEMEALCFYYHEHELAHVDMNKYGLVNFFSLSEIPVVETIYRKNIPIYKLYNICGTCIAKNKDKGIVYLLTTEGVVPIKFRKEYFSLFDQQISRKNLDGTKTIIERSWFNKGNKIIVHGMRRGNEFVSKKYKKSNCHQLYKIEEVYENGTLKLTSERKSGEVEE